MSISPVEIVLYEKHDFIFGKIWVFTNKIGSSWVCNMLCWVVLWYANGPMFWPAMYFAGYSSLAAYQRKGGITCCGSEGALFFCKRWFWRLHIYNLIDVGEDCWSTWMWAKLKVSSGFDLTCSAVVSFRHLRSLGLNVATAWQRSFF